MNPSGPRRLVFKTIKDRNQQLDIPSSGTAYTADTPLEPQNLRIHTSSKPQLIEGADYTVNISQTVVYNDTSGNQVTGDTPSAISKEFTVQGSKWTLDPALISTVYPQQGHSDYSTVLPHVVFNSSQVPWMIEGAEDANLSSPAPWLGLIVFTEDELQLNSNDLTTLQTASGVAALSPTSTFSYPMTAQQLVNIEGVASPTYTFDPPDMEPGSQVETIFLQDSLAHKLLQPYNAYPNNTPISSPTKPDLSRFNFMSHVRRYNGQGMANSDGSSNLSLAVTASPRCGPLDITTPTTVYAHLVCLSGFKDIYRLDSPGTSGLTALISLYSWSYTCLPPTLTSMSVAFRALANNIQPLRNPDPATSGNLSTKMQPQRPIKGIDPSIDTWVQNRMLAGYSLIRYVMQTGEPTIALRKGMLVPISPIDLDLPQSHVGSDLAILDPELGYLDITYQVAWQLGKLTISGDRDVSAALVRIKNSIHHQSMTTAKSSTADTFVSAGTAVSGLPGAMAAIKAKLANGNAQLSAERWAKPQDTTSTRSFTSFSNSYVKSAYLKTLGTVMPMFAAAAPEHQSDTVRKSRLSDAEVDVSNLSIYNEVNSAANTDYAILLAWVFDKWFLHGIPWANLISDPAYIPRESIRTFYVDPNWIKAFVDGAFSVGEHYTDDDDVRGALQDAMTKHLSTNIQSGNYNNPPQIPRWGFLLRSKIVGSTPDLRINAPRAPNDTSTAAEVLRMEVVDQDLMLVLFDRVPGQFHPELGIRIHPPEHQLTFKLGEEDDSGGLFGGNLTMKWRKIYSNPGSVQDHTSPFVSSSGIYNKTQASGSVFDFDPETRSLIFPHFSHEAANAQSSSETNASSPTPAVVGSQLIGKTTDLTMLTTGGHDVAPWSINLRPRTTSNGIFAPVPPRQTPTVVYRPSLPAPVVTDTIPKAVKLVANKYCPDLTALHRAIGTSGLTFGRDQNTKYPDLYPVPAQLGILISNITGPAGFQHVVAYRPVNSGFTTDLHIQLRCKDPSKTGFCANSIQVIFDLGTDDSVLYPFQTSVSISALQPGGALDFPHKPSTSGVRMPKVRFTGIGKRWKISTTSFDKYRYTVNLVPSYKSRYPLTETNPWGDVALNPNLDFVLQDVQICPPKGTVINQPQVSVIENYRLARGYKAGTSGLAGSSFNQVCVIGYDVIDGIEAANS